MRLEIDFWRQNSLLSPIRGQTFSTLEQLHAFGVTVMSDNHDTTLKVVHLRYPSDFDHQPECPISPAASPEILHHTGERTWLYIAYSEER